MLEICVQIKGTFEEIKKVILAQGYEFVESYDNYDTYFTTIQKDKIKEVLYKQLLDNSLIVRNIIGKDYDIKNIIYKKKTLDENGNVANEIDTKLDIDNIQKAKAIFSSMGLNCWCEYINHNNEFKKGEIVLNIQFVKELGMFIEVEEFESIKNKTNKEKLSILIEIINSLGFEIGNDYSCKKPFMILNNKSTTK